MCHSTSVHVQLFSEIKCWEVMLVKKKKKYFTLVVWIMRTDAPETLDYFKKGVFTGFVLQKIWGFCVKHGLLGCVALGYCNSTWHHNPEDLNLSVVEAFLCKGPSPVFATWCCSKPVHTSSCYHNCSLNIHCNYYTFVFQVAPAPISMWISCYPIQTMN